MNGRRVTNGGIEEEGGERTARGHSSPGDNEQSTDGKVIWLICAVFPAVWSTAIYSISF